MDTRKHDIEHEWIRVLQKLWQMVPEREFETWLWPLEPELGTQGELRLVVPFAYFYDAVRRRYGALLREIAGGEIPARVGLSVEASSLQERGWRRTFKALVLQLDRAPVPGRESWAELPSIAEDIAMDEDNAKLDIVPVVIEMVAGTFGLSVEEMMSSTRDRHKLWPRQATAYLARKLTGLSYPKLADAFDNFNDHTTIIRAERRTILRMEEDEDFAKKLQVAEQAVRKRCGMHPASSAAR